MNKDQFVRYRAMDRCFRNANGFTTIDILMEECEKALKAFHPGEEQVYVSRRTIEKDLYDIQLREKVKFEPNLRIGHKKIYRYVDTSYSLIKDLLSDSKVEKELLDEVLDTLSLYDDVPEYQWLYVFIQDRLHGKGSDGTNLITFDDDEKVDGMEYFSLILNSIMQQQPLCIEYKPFEQDTIIFKAHPYMVKQFNRRWYLIAKTEQYPIANIALDRIREIKPIEIEFIPCDIDLNNYFKNVIGVTRFDDKPIEEVLIRVTKKRYNYIRTKKLHPTQEVVYSKSDKDYTVVKLSVQLNNELEARILSLGSDALVLQPETLRNSIKEKIQTLYEQYR